ncbi:hypothetical protein GNI_045190 [Gregarina niphandrodes]|uniref:Uncharacterized protein n=1 Tax=Gregarina niphandrodes TaxID=110365 RepID=A0A023B9W7_GRENI|nr:hypothetical protein GNI_045190 [Gregarina niphandrodes]EZG76298.1 hypothetical protein GNI_045190 [Gregarina niphandrodes]|eukprot:XP_011129579.1 hypothetical protein GNI_045190 [Gregarina niphandrodes]
MKCNVCAEGERMVVFAELARFVIPVVFDRHVLDLVSIAETLDSYSLSRDLSVLWFVASELRSDQTGLCVVLGGDVFEEEYGSSSDSEKGRCSEKGVENLSFIELLMKEPELQECLMTLVTDLAKRAESLVGGEIKLRQFKDVLQALNGYRYHSNKSKYDLTREIAFDHEEENCSSLEALAASYRCMHRYTKGDTTVLFPASHTTCQMMKLPKDAAKRLENRIRDKHC